VPNNLIPYQQLELPQTIPEAKPRSISSWQVAQKTGGTSHMITPTITPISLGQAQNNRKAKPDANGIFNAVTQQISPRNANQRSRLIRRIRRENRGNHELLLEKINEELIREYQNAVTVKQALSRGLASDFGASREQIHQGHSSK